MRKKPATLKLAKAGDIPEAAVRMAWYSDNAVRKVLKKKRVSYAKYRAAMKWTDPNTRIVTHNMLAKPNEPETTSETMLVNPYEAIMKGLYE